MYNSPILVSFEIPGAIAASNNPTKRLIIPFAFELAGVTISANTAPTGAALIVDILSGNNGQTGLVAPTNSVFKTQANRPTLAIGANDQAGVSAPFNLAFSGDTAVEPNELSFLAKPDPTSTSTFAGNQPVNTTAPPVLVNSTEGATQNQPQSAANRGFIGVAGSVLAVAVPQVGSVVAGADLQVMLYIIQR